MVNMEGVMLGMEGVMVDREGVMVDREGVMVDREGAVVNREDVVVDKEGVIVDKEGVMVGRKGVMVDREGVVVGTVKKLMIFPSPWPGIIKLFPTRESLVSDIPAGDGKSLTFYYSVHLIHGYIAFTLNTKCTRFAGLVQNLAMLYCQRRRFLSNLIKSNSYI
jgi:hypothetical protein